MSAGKVLNTISPNDEMYRDGEGEREFYFQLGREAVELSQAALDFEPATILDLPCGHGRVLRWLAAEWPEAAITACDLDRDAVDFCAETFDATPLYGSEDPHELELGSYDLIWVGSLFTHLPAHRWNEFLSFFREHLDGVLVFTTSGTRNIRELLKHPCPFARFATPEHVRTIRDGYDHEGFGYVDYPGCEGYGVSVATPEWVKGRLEAFRLLSYRVHGWGGQDVVAVR